jgi:heptosyltransferase-2
LIALLPGAEYGPAKRWPTERFAALAAELARLGAEIIVLGSAKEATLGEELCAGADSARVHNLCGKTTLADVVDLLSAAAAAVSNDSGLMHVAAAAGTHVVAIYGSSSPKFTPPLSDASTVLYLGLSCSPCFARTCPLGHLNCLRQIDVGTVLAAVEAVLGARTRLTDHAPTDGKRAGG